MVRKYELLTHFPGVYADLRAVRNFAMILVLMGAQLVPLSGFTIRRERVSV